MKKTGIVAVVLPAIVANAVYAMKTRIPGFLEVQPGLLDSCAPQLT
jgi:hypothetical protein